MYWITNKRDNFLNHKSHRIIGHDVAHRRETASRALSDDSKFALYAQQEHGENLVEFCSQICVERWQDRFQNAQRIDDILSQLLFDELIRFLGRVWDIEE